MKKRILSVLLTLAALACLVTALIIGSNAANIVSGTIGDLTWALADDGTLTISGSGKMPNFTQNDVPWMNYREQIKKAVIQDGVTTVGDYAFFNCINMTSVDLPNTLRSYTTEAGFGTCAFKNSGLTSITIPEQILHLKPGSLMNCPDLKTIKILGAVSWYTESGLEAPYDISSNSPICQIYFPLASDGIYDKLAVSGSIMYVKGINPISSNTTIAYCNGGIPKGDLPEDLNSLAELEKEGFTFVGWYDSKGKEYNSENPAEAYYAKWEIKEGYVAVNYVDSLNNLHSTWSLKPTDSVGLNINKLDLGHEGIRLLGWTIEGDDTNTIYGNDTKLKDIFTDGSTDITLNAVWIPILYIGGNELEYDIMQNCYIADADYTPNGYTVKFPDEVRIKKNDCTYQSSYSTKWKNENNETISAPTLTVPGDSGKYNVSMSFGSGSYLISTDLLVSINIKKIDNIKVNKKISYAEALELAELVEQGGDTTITIEPRDISYWQGEPARAMIDAGYLVCKVKEIPENFDEGIKVTLYVNDDAIEKLEKSQYYDYLEEYEGVLTVTREVVLQPKSDIIVDYGFVVNDMNTSQTFGDYFDLDAFWISLPDVVKTNIEAALEEEGVTKDILPAVLSDAIYMSIQGLDSSSILPAKSEHTVQIFMRSVDAYYGLYELLASFGLPKNYEISVKSGSLKVKDIVSVDYKVGGDFDTIYDADSDYNVGITKYLIALTDSMLEEIDLSISDNIIFKDSTDANVSLTGNITIEYCRENDDNLYNSGPLTWADTVGAKYIARITYEGDDIYSSFEAYVLVSIKSKLTIAAPQKTVFLGDTFDITNVDLILEGDVLNVPDFKEVLYSALPDLVKAGVIKISLDDNVTLTDAGNYTINVEFNQNALNDLPYDYKYAASLFDISTRNGQLNVVDISEITGDIEELKKSIEDKTTALENALNKSAEELAKAVADLSDLKKSLSNYATVERLNAVKKELSDADIVINSAIKALETKVGTLVSDLATANGKIDVNSKDIDDLKSAITTLKSRMDSAEGAILELKKLTSELQAKLDEKISALNTALAEANNKIVAAEQRITDLEDKVENLEKQLKDAVDNLQEQIDTKASTADLADAIARLKAAITTAMDDADLQDAALKSALEAADATLNKAIEELKTQLGDLQDALKNSNANIQTNTTDIGTLNTQVRALEGQIKAAQNAITSLTTALSATNEELKSAVERLEAELNTANENLTAAVDRIAVLEGKVEDLESAKEKLEKAIIDLQTALSKAATTEALANEVKALNAAITEAKKSASDADTALKETFDAANATLATAVAELQNRLTGIEIVLTSLNDSVNTNTDDIKKLKNSVQSIELWKGEAEKAIEALGILIGTNESGIAELQNSVTKLQESVYAADGKIAAAEARIAVLEGKVEELESVKTELLNSVANLQAALATKADRATVNNAISALQASISSLQAAQNNYIFGDMMLKNELTAAIETAKELVISTARELVSESKTELLAEIGKKADSATLEAKTAELADAIALAESVAKDYTDAQNAILKEAVNEEIKAANSLIESLGNRMTDAETAIANLEAAVDALNKATADDAQALEDAVAALNRALTDAKALASESDAEIESALSQKIAEAQNDLNSKVSDVQSKLNKAVKELKSADASNAGDLKKAIDDVETAMSAADAVRDAADKALETKIADAKSELANKIAEVQANLASAKDELSKSLDAGDTALNEKVKALNEALEAAKAASATSDADLKAELTAKIDEADAAIYALIEQIQKELKDANIELNTVVEQADEELKNKVTTSTIIASAGVGGNVALLAWIIISKKRKLF